MTEETIQMQRPPDKHKILKDKFAESIAAQSELMDKLGQQLLTLELAIPGLYATVLKLTSGDKATVSPGPWLYATFGCWFVALFFTLASLTPRKWRVDENIMKQDPFYETKAMGVEDFFNRAASYKRWLLITASLFFFSGVSIASFSIF